MFRRSLLPLVLVPLVLMPLLLGLAGCGHVSSKNAAPPTASRLTGESGVTEVKNFSALTTALGESGSRKTLLVLDIDDTLLTSKVFFGSDRWYEWQKSLGAHDPGTVACKFDVIALNYEAGTQVATEGDSGSALVNGIGGDRLILTARSPGYRAGTVRELHAAGYVLPTMLGGAPDGLVFRWQPTPDAKPADISYQDGVMMIAGQDKGKLLVELLRRLDLRYDRVVLLDDGRRNIDSMQAALGGAGIDYRGLWYTRVDKAISDADKVAGTEGWLAMRTWLGKVFPERLQRMDLGQCAY